MTTKKTVRSVKSNSKQQAKPKKANAPKFDFTKWLATEITTVFGEKSPPGSPDLLVLELKRRLPREHMREYRKLIVRSKVFAAFEVLFWKGQKDILNKFIRASKDVKEVHAWFESHHAGSDIPPPPLWVVEWKIRAMRGFTKPKYEAAADLHGVLRQPFLGAPVAEIPDSSFLNPLRLLADKKSAHLIAMSAPQIGLPYAADIEENRTRCVFALARRRRADGILVSGPLLGGLNMTKTVGPSRMLRDLLSAIEVNVESLAKNYGHEAEELLKLGVFSPVFVRADEMFNEAMRGWTKVFIRPTGKPEFEGWFGILLNALDLEMGQIMAYFEILPQMYERLHKAIAESALAAEKERKAWKKVVEAEEGGNRDAIRTARTHHEQMSSELKQAVFLETRIRMTNLYPKKNVEFLKKARDYIISLFHKHLPGVEIVGQNSLYATFGDFPKPAQFVTAKNRSLYEKLMKEYGKRQRNRELPPLVVAMHPNAIQYNKGARENYIEGKERGTSAFVEAPIMVDRQAIIAAADGFTPTQPIFETIMDERFGAGVLAIRFDPRFEMPDVQEISEEEVVRAGRKEKGYKPPEMIHCFHMTDTHIAGANQAYIDLPSDLRISLSSAAMLQARKYTLKYGCAPFHTFHILDDAIQGNHFGTELRPTRHRLLLPRITRDVLERMERIDRKRTGQVAEYKTLVADLHRQLQERQSDHGGTQLEEFCEEILIPFREVYMGVLKRARQADIVVRGVGDHLGLYDDSCNVGVITLPNGNHATATFKERMYEGAHLRRVLCESLRWDPQMAGYDVYNLIRAPLFQDEAIGYGTMQARGGYEWGLHILGTQPNRTSWQLLLAGWIETQMRIGNPSGILDGKKILNWCGNHHFGATARAGGDYYAIFPSCTRTDAYAYKARGLPENTPGVAVFSVPARGPDYGDPTYRHIPVTDVQLCFDKGIDLPWEDYAPNGLINPL